MSHSVVVALALSSFVALASPVSGQTWPTDDPVLERIWEVGFEESRVSEMAQVLTDSIGPRLTGSPGMERAQEWAVGIARSWGVEARNEEYGTWTGWNRGPTHVDLIEPRVRTLDARMLAWSPSTDGPVEGEVEIVPAYRSVAELEAWLGTVRGKFVAISFAYPSCRPDSHYAEFGSDGALQRMQLERQAAFQAFMVRVPDPVALAQRLEAAGAAGILQSEWTGGVATNMVHDAITERIPNLDLSCEDYGLLWRLAENGQGPVIRVDAQAERLGEVPVANTIITLPGTELPDEYIVFSAHFDSWDSASGATDNATGSVAVLEAMRILAEAYPNPRRTIIGALWNGEEQGINGSRRFVQMHPEIPANLQALFNHDVGTGRVETISAQGLVDAGEELQDWLADLPPELTSGIRLDLPGLPSAGSSDHAAFVCSGAPGFNLGLRSWSYTPLTWHTNLDTFDKIVVEEIQRNAVLMAMLAYEASEDPERVGRERRELPPGPGGRVMVWPSCEPGAAAP